MVESAFRENYSLIWWLVLSSSLSAAISAILIAYPLLAAILSSNFSEGRQWDYEQLRVQRLREASALFRSLERWIVGIANMISLHAPWFLKLETRQSLRLTYRGFEVLFGRSADVARAVRVGQIIEPWTPAEVVAVGWIFGCLTSGCVLVTLMQNLSAGAMIVALVLSWLGAYRVWIAWFAANAEARRRSMRLFLPHAMDCIAMVMSAGGTFREGVETVVRDFPDQPLSQELSGLRMEMDHGRPLLSALKESASRICLPEFDELVSVLTRTSEHGAPGAASFARLSKQLRVHQLRWMEAEIGKADAKMALPTMLAVFSCMLFVAAPFGLQFLEFGLFKLSP